MQADAKEVQDSAAAAHDQSSLPASPHPPITTSPDMASNQPARPRRSARFAPQTSSGLSTRSESRQEVAEHLSSSQHVAADKEEETSILGVPAVAAAEDDQSRLELQSQSESSTLRNPISGRLRERKRKEPEPDEKLAQELPAKRSRRARQLGPPLPLSEQAEATGEASARPRPPGPTATKPPKAKDNQKAPTQPSSSLRVRALGKQKGVEVNVGEPEEASMDGTAMNDEGEDEVPEEEDDEEETEEGPSSFSMRPGKSNKKAPAPKPKKKQLPDDVWTAYKASLPMLHHRTQTRMPELYEKYRSFWISKAIYAPVKKSPQGKKGASGSSANGPLFFFWDPLSLVPNIQCQQPGCTRFLTRDGFAPWPRKVRSEQPGNDLTFWLVGARYRCNNCAAVKPKTNKAPYTSYLGWDLRLLKAIPDELRDAFPCEEKGKLFYINKGVVPEENLHEHLFDRIEANAAVGEPPISNPRQPKIKKTVSPGKEKPKKYSAKSQGKKGRPSKTTSAKPWEAPSPPESAHGEDEDEVMEPEVGHSTVQYGDEDASGSGDEGYESEEGDEVPVSSSTASAEAHSNATTDSRTRGVPSIAGSSITAVAVPPEPRPPALIAKSYQSYQPAYSDWRTSSLRSTTGEEQQRAPPPSTYPYPYPPAIRTETGWYANPMPASSAAGPMTPTATPAAAPPWTTPHYFAHPPQQQHQVQQAVAQPGWAPPPQSVVDPSAVAALASLATHMSYGPPYGYQYNPYHSVPVPPNVPPHAQEYRPLPHAQATAPSAPLHGAVPGPNPSSSG
ncbi:hypothetical protein FRB90_010065 [Tulasnella sp. 427]|nr:hypothetical protein FRB90_010065 [Tulasnella sp. 427]